MRPTFAKSDWSCAVTYHDEPSVPPGPVVTIGTVVRLKSGGPAMTVENPIVRTDVRAIDLQCDCAWISADGHLHRERFDIAMLESADAAAQRPVGVISDSRFGVNYTEGALAAAEEQHAFEPAAGSFDCASCGQPFGFSVHSSPDEDRRP